MCARGTCLLPEKVAKHAVQLTGTQTSREGQQAASKGGRRCQMPPEGVYVQSLLIMYGSIPVRDTQHSAATHMQHFCCPCPHIAKALHRASVSMTLFAVSYVILVRQKACDDQYGAADSLQTWLATPTHGCPYPEHHTCGSCFDAAQKRVLSICIRGHDPSAKRQEVSCISCRTGSIHRRE